MAVPAKRRRNEKDKGARGKSGKIVDIQGEEGEERVVRVNHTWSERSSYQARSQE